MGKLGKEQPYEYEGRCQLMNPSLQAVTEWLNANSNQTLHISKIEEQDQDQVNMHLERAELQRRQIPSIDGYTDINTLLLEGDGFVITGGHQAPLPDKSFVIALDGLSEADVQSGQVMLKTERGTYSITVPGHL